MRAAARERDKSLSLLEEEKEDEIAAGLDSPPSHRPVPYQ